MPRLSKIETKGLQAASRVFTFPNDSCFRDFAQGMRALKRLTKLELVAIQVNDDGTRQWEATAEGRHQLKWGYTDRELTAQTEAERVR